jgi:hypothetical protein
MFQQSLSITRTLYFSVGLRPRLSEYVFVFWRPKENTKSSVGIVLNRSTTFQYIDVSWDPDTSLRNAGLNVSALFTNI